MTFQAAVLGLGLAVLVAAAAHDIIARTIPNLASAVVAGSGLVLRIEDGTLGIAVTSAGVVLATGIVFWRAGWLGGGDAKLLAAVSLLLPPSQLLAAIVNIAGLGAALALPYLAGRGRIVRPLPGRRSLALPLRAWRAELFRLRRGGPLPYGAAIAAGVLLSALGPIR